MLAPYLGSLHLLKDTAPDLHNTSEFCISVLEISVNFGKE